MKYSKKRTGEEEPKICSRCGKDKTGDKKFGKKKRICNACQAAVRYFEKKGKEDPGYKARSGKEPRGSATDGGGQPSAGHKKSIKTGEKPSLYVDFTGYEDIYERLKQSARESIRTPEMQTVFIIKDFCE